MIKAMPDRPMAIFSDGRLLRTDSVRSAFTSAFLRLLIMVAIVLIFDLMHTQKSVASINQQPMLELQQMMHAQNVHEP